MGLSFKKLSMAIRFVNISTFFFLDKRAPDPPHGPKEMELLLFQKKLTSFFSETIKKTHINQIIMLKILAASYKCVFQNNFPHLWQLHLKNYTSHHYSQIQADISHVIFVAFVLNWGIESGETNCDDY